MSTDLKIQFAFASDKGIKTDNQDACNLVVPDKPVLINKGIVAAVADGVSSSQGGGLASAACIRGLISDYYSTPDSWSVKHAGQKVLGALNRWLHGQGYSQYHSATGMLTTLSALILKSTSAHLFHVGDTRIYRLRVNELEQLTRDHQNWVSTEKAFLSRAMGADCNVEIDYRLLPLERDDLYILTSDGVHQFLPSTELVRLIDENPTNLQQAAQQIVTHALQAGSNDNLTCLLLRIEQLPNQQPDEFYRQLTELPFPPPLTEGMLLDGYKILRELHASKRTQVYLALDTNNDADSDTKVIIKTPSVNYEDDPAYIDQFLHEEWAGRRIDNNHVLHVVKPKRQRRLLYYVCEYINGQTLRQWMDDHPQPDINAVRGIIEQIAAGLRAFHRLEMLHQDLKPENIMIDAHGTVKIIDFGSTTIAGIREISTPLRQQQPLGTLDYAAPEYFLEQPASNRSDIYSLGAIAYEMLCGKLPYGGPLSRRVIKKGHYQSIRQHNPELPVWIDACLHKAVHLEPDQRYELLSEFTHDLSRPNPAFINEKPLPLLERNPTAFWRALALVSAAVNIFLFYLLTNQP